MKENEKKNRNFMSVSFFSYTKSSGGLLLIFNT